MRLQLHSCITDCSSVRYFWIRNNLEYREQKVSLARKSMTDSFSICKIYLFLHFFTQNRVFRLQLHITLLKSRNFIDTSSPLLAPKICRICTIKDNPTIHKFVLTIFSPKIEYVVGNDKSAYQLKSVYSFSQPLAQFISFLSPTCWWLSTVPCSLVVPQFHPPDELQVD